MCFFQLLCDRSPKPRYLAERLSRLSAQYFPEGRDKASNDDIANFASYLLNDIWVGENVPFAENSKCLWEKFVKEFSWNGSQAAGWQVYRDPRC